MTPVLLPGNMCDARLWRGGDGAIVGMLARRGHTPADADLSRDDGIAAMAARTLAATAGPPLPIGFSIGAIIAVEMWTQAPKRIAGLVLLGYDATADLPDRAAHRPAQQAEVRAGGHERVLVQELKPKYLAAHHRGDAVLLDLLRDMGLGLGPDVFARQSGAAPPRRPPRRVAGHHRSGADRCGDEDTLCPPAWHADWAARMAGSDAFSIAGVGHMLSLEVSPALAAHIDRWLDRKDIENAQTVEIEEFYDTTGNANLQLAKDQAVTLGAPASARLVSRRIIRFSRARAEESDGAHLHRQP